MHYSDEYMVKKVLAGEKQFFAQIVDRYQRQVYNLMFRYTGNPEESADLTQEAFWLAFDRLPTFRNEGRFFSWLYKLALNLAYDWVRKRNNSKVHYLSFDNTNEGQTAATQHTQLEFKEEVQLVEQSLLQLSERTREVLILRYRHEQAIKEVAEIFDLSESAVKMRIKRGLEQLREAMSKKGAFDEQGKP